MKRLFKNILCPVDFDDNSVAILKLAAELSEEADGTLWLLHVIPVLVAEAGVPLEPFPISEQDAKAKLEEIARDHLGEKARHQILVRVGDPARVILKVAEERNVDSIVMATHGRKGIGRLLLGSVAEQVVRGSTRPVLTVRPKPDGT
jgi:nucleotide-binding universal stress UspA family protein